MNRVYNLNIRPTNTGKTEPDIERGRHLFESVALCAECHGEDLGGKVLTDDPITGRITAPNLTKGSASDITGYIETDWIRTVRHGIGRDGKPLLQMPSHIYFYLSDKDLRSIIEYIESVEPILTELPVSKIRLPGRFLFLIGKLPLLSAEAINHHAPRPIPPQEGVTTEYGRYLAIIGRCLDCHGPDLTGAPPTPFQPKLPHAPDISPAGTGELSNDDFSKIMREGIRPDGSAINPAMPWKLTAGLTGDELGALLLYIKTFAEKKTALPNDKTGEEEKEVPRKPEGVKTSDK
jgi:mono/diheme cytochrome c family protein